MNKIDQERIYEQIINSDKEITIDHDSYFKGHFIAYFKINGTQYSFAWSELWGIELETIEVDQ